MKASQIDVLVPEVIPTLTCKKVLTMTRLNGYKVNDKLALALLDIDKFALLSRITHCLARQMLVDGVLNGKLYYCYFF